MTPEEILKAAEGVRMIVEDEPEFDIVAWLRTFQIGTCSGFGPPSDYRSPIFHPKYTN